MITIQIGNKTYKVIEAKSEEDRQQGLKGYKELPQDQGMLFYMSDEQPVYTFTMQEMQFPIDIIFINQDQEVVSVKYNCQPGQEEIINDTHQMLEDDYIAYVLEVNPESGIVIGDILEFEERVPVMKVLFPDGSEQMALYGGERIVSRKETKVLIKKAKKAKESQNDKDYKSLGKYIFKVFDKQDNREPEYVQNPNKN